MDKAFVMQIWIPEFGFPSTHKKQVVAIVENHL